LYQLNQEIIDKAATSEKKMPSAKAKHPTELIRQIQKDCVFLS